jgi:hypothetical protein
MPAAIHSHCGDAVGLLEGTRHDRCSLHKYNDLERLFYARSPDLGTLRKGLPSFLFSHRLLLIRPSVRQLSQHIAVAGLRCAPARQ